jgi:hypothetical protein
VDQVMYNERGNEVLLVKYLEPVTGFKGMKNRDAA